MFDAFISYRLQLWFQDGDELWVSGAKFIAERARSHAFREPQVHHAASDVDQPARIPSALEDSFCLVGIVSHIWDRLNGDADNSW